MGSHYSLRQPRQAGSRGAPPEAGGGVRSQSDMQRAGGGKEAGGGGGGECVPGWHIGVAGNGITETVKAGVGRLQVGMGPDDDRYPLLLGVYNSLS